MLEVISRITHVATAIVLVGGSTFVLFVLHPAVTGLAEDIRSELASRVQGRWKRFVHIGVTLFLVSGFYNYVRAMPLHRGDSLWHGLMGGKMLLAFAVFFLAAAMVGRGKLTARFRRQRTFWLTTLVLFAAIIVAISGYLKVRGSNVPSTMTIEVSDRAAPVASP